MAEQVEDAQEFRLSEADRKIFLSHLDNELVDRFIVAIRQELAAKGIGPTGVWPDHRLREWNHNGGITLSNGEPYAAKIGPGSVDLSLDGTIRTARWYWRNRLTRSLVWAFLSEKQRDLRAKENYDLYWNKLTPFSQCVLWPKHVALLSTTEWVNMPDDALGLIRVRSSIGRIFLESMDAGVVDPGFKGNLTLEFFNPSPFPIYLHKYDFYVQMVVFDLSSEAEKPYRGKYQNQVGLTLAKPDNGEKVEGLNGVHY